MALNQKDLDAITTVIDQRLAAGLRLFQEKLDTLQVAMKAEIDRAVATAGAMPEATRRLLATDIQRAITEMLDQASQTLPAGVVLAMREAAPALMSGVAPEMVEPGPLSQRHWLVEEACDAFIAGQGRVTLEKGRVLDSSSYPVMELVRQSKPVRRLYASELERHHVAE